MSLTVTDGKSLLGKVCNRAGKGFPGGRTFSDKIGRVLGKPGGVGHAAAEVSWQTLFPEYDREPSDTAETCFPSSALESGEPEGGLGAQRQ